MLHITADNNMKLANLWFSGIVINNTLTAVHIQLLNGVFTTNIYS